MLIIIMSTIVLPKSEIQSHKELHKYFSRYGYMFAFIALILHHIFLLQGTCLAEVLLTSVEITCLLTMIAINNN